MTEVIIEDVHTKDMIESELMYCIGDKGSMLTLARFMHLCRKKSPYIHGGVVSDKDRVVAKIITNQMTLADSSFDAMITDELAAVSRAFEIVETEKNTGQKSIIPPYGPEWLADFMTAVADAMPSLTPDAMLHKTPMVLLIHLAAASHRKNGGVTKRPENVEEAYRKLMELSDQSEQTTDET